MYCTTLQAGAAVWWGIVLQLRSVCTARHCSHTTTKHSVLHTRCVALQAEMQLCDGVGLEGVQGGLEGVVNQEQGRSAERACVVSPLCF